MDTREVLAGEEGARRMGKLARAYGHVLENMQLSDNELVALKQ